MVDAGNESPPMRRRSRAAMPAAPPPVSGPNFRAGHSNRLTAPEHRGRPGLTRVRRLPRLAPLLRLAAALVALAVLFVHDAPAARAGTAARLGDEERLLGVGTLTVGAGANWRGFRHSPSTGQLTRTWFTYQGVNYTIRWLVEHNTSDFLILELDKAIPAGLKSALVLYIEDRRFALADGVINPTNDRQIRWANSGESWTAGQQFHVTTSFTDYWSATLNVKTVNGLGCDTSSSTTANKCSTSATLSDNTITLRGTTHTISGVRLFVQGAERNLWFELANHSGTYGAVTALERYTLYVGNKPFHFADCNGSIQYERERLLDQRGPDLVGGPDRPAAPDEADIHRGDVPGRYDQPADGCAEPRRERRGRFPDRAAARSRRQRNRHREAVEDDHRLRRLSQQPRRRPRGCPDRQSLARHR